MRKSTAIVRPPYRYVSASALTSATAVSPASDISRFRVSDAARQMGILGSFIFRILGKVKTQLTYWTEQATLCGDDMLRRQAVLSIRMKGFHCRGGAVFAVRYPHAQSVLLDLIVAYQTLCDYLDNLCDRAGHYDGEAFRQLHEALFDALTPGGACADHYRSFKFKDDGGYITKLIETCRQCLVRLPSYSIVRKDVLELAGLYRDLQVLKHLDKETREEALVTWAESHLARYPSIKWQEFSAASGSTLAIFALFGLAAEDGVGPRDVRRVVETYFPWVCGLHILLDYFIDRREDRYGGDLNFTFYYRHSHEMIDRLSLFIEEAKRKCSGDSDPVFLKTVIDGLLAMYLSDPKVRQQGFEKMAAELMRVAGASAKTIRRICAVVRTTW